MATKKTSPAEGTHYRNTGDPLYAGGRRIEAGALCPAVVIDSFAQASSSVREWIADGRLVLCTPSGEIVAPASDPAADARELRAERDRLLAIVEKAEAERDAAKAAAAEHEANALQAFAERDAALAERDALAEALDSATAPEPDESTVVEVDDDSERA